MPSSRGITMGDNFKTCELHGKPFPNNMIDTRKTEVSRVYVERKEDIEGKTVTLSLFLGNSENEGFDACATCLQEKLLTVLSGNGDSPTWKGIQWHQETMTRKDGSGTYQKNVKTVKDIDEIALEIKESKKQK